MVQVSRMTPLVAYLLLFVAVGAGFIFVHLMAGKLIRPDKPGPEKKTIYECGEPTIGTAWIQFDLRFYVVALLFVIFDVEVAFFFPWAEVFGRANAMQHASPPASTAERLKYVQELDALVPPYSRKPDHKDLDLIQQQLSKPPEMAGSEVAGNSRADAAALAARIELEQQLEAKVAEVFPNSQGEARSLAWLALGDILVFFGVLLVGFAYLWKRGDLEWVRSVSDRTAPAVPQVKPAAGRAAASVGS
jgi:NADH-quinone oxidoreductase subunit A